MAKKKKAKSPSIINKRENPKVDKASFMELIKRSVQPSKIVPAKG